MLLPLFKGFGASGSLIVAIGAQNAFVIKQSLRCQHLFLTALLCSVIDAGLILLGVNGFGHLVMLYPYFIEMTKYLATLFLIVYGMLSFKSAWQAKSMEANSLQKTPSSIKTTVLTILAFSLLNPHVYLDTVILLGSIASQQLPEEQIFFSMGAVSASFAWFFAITYGAQLLAPVLHKQSTWRVIDIVIGATMWILAYLL